MYLTITLKHLIGFLIGFLYFNTINYVLNKKTQYNNCELTTKYCLIFTIFGLFCFLFIDKIKEKRKIECFEILVKDYEKFGIDDNDIFDDENREEYLNMKRYLKLKKIKNKTKWKRVKEMVKL